jgi:hypothetical protein
MKKKYIGLPGKYPLFPSDFYKLEFLDIFEKNSKMKFHENLSSASGVVPHVWKDRRKDRLMKPIGVFCNFAKGPKKSFFKKKWLVISLYRRVFKIF